MCNRFDRYEKLQFSGETVKAVGPLICDLLVWESYGTHGCRGKPIPIEERSEGDFEFQACWLVLTTIFRGDDDEWSKKRVPQECPRKYTWEQMKARVGPAITLALAERDKQGQLEKVGMQP